MKIRICFIFGEVASSGVKGYVEIVTEEAVDVCPEGIGHEEGAAENSVHEGENKKDAVGMSNKWYLAKSE